VSAVLPEFPATHLPRPNGRSASPRVGSVGRPSPSIGKVVYATSDLGPDGVALDWRPPTRGQRVRNAFGYFVVVGIVSFGLAFGLAALEVLRFFGRGQPEIVLFLLVGATPAIAAAAHALFGAPKPRRRGTRIYLGTEGIEVHRVAGAKVRIERALHREAAFTLHAQARILFDGIPRKDRTLLGYFDGHGRLILEAEACVPAGAPSSGLHRGVERAASLVALLRSEQAEATLASGGSVRFPFVGSRRIGGDAPLGHGQIVVGRDQVEVERRGGRRRFARADVAVRVSEGMLEIVPRTPGAEKEVVSLAELGDADVLLAIFR
jgi:hypothetical protein